MTLKELRSNFYKGRAKRYSWPGCYPLSYLLADGCFLCPHCVTENRKAIFFSTLYKVRDGWCLDAVYINWEDNTLVCDQCNSKIPCAYETDPDLEDKIESLKAQKEAKA